MYRNIIGNTEVILDCKDVQWKVQGPGPEHLATVFTVFNTPGYFYDTRGLL